jgi:arginine decarboxylase
MDRLNAFELALRDAEIEKVNLISGSNVLPPGCELLSREKGVEQLHDGQIAFCVMARKESNEPGKLLAASIGVAAPKDESQHGYLSEHHSFGETDEQARDRAEKLAASLLASSLGVDFDQKENFDPETKLYRISGQTVKPGTMVQAARAHKAGKWTCCVAAAVFVF